MNELASIPLLRAMGWTLLHSLWQGALAGLLAAVALRLARHRSAEFRYALAAGALGLLVLAFAGTLVWLSAGGDPLAGADAVLITPLAEGRGASGWLPQLRQALGPWIPGLFLAWVLGFSLRLVQLGRSMAWLYGTCLRSFLPPPAEWLARFEALRIRSRVQFPVRLGLSDQVDSLVVLGWLKPVVLVPAAALLALPPEGLEAVLAHELAHVRRGDFLANLVQTFAEALLFYHPAVWWLSRRIRQEREHCCDDAAVRACGDPILYASALAGLEELRLQPTFVSDLAPAASGGRLMSRTQRLLRPRITHDPAAPLAALLPAILLVAALGAATLAASDAPKAPTAGPMETDFKKVRIKHQPEAPRYPSEAKAARIQGTVVVVVTIGIDGKVTEAKAESGPPELQACAVDYAKAWEFEPVRVKGKVVPARFKLTMPFRLR
ncbi:MAG: TonB family protein [Geothrix sp.]|uniref:M56 family metallopeptidase n=1 Tax=Geothrix sp. TaxID=1962974 RepID=UPI0017EEE1F9|nr:M56 family metallopeptidase [Geothrix sp.]NWJ39604.1 TonB family protein [Geothrix sp.]WIL22373.1 MAG: M56 family metallopeptidase [Geothrix sp.]